MNLACPINALKDARQRARVQLLSWRRLLLRSVVTVESGETLAEGASRPKEHLGRRSILPGCIDWNRSQSSRVGPGLRGCARPLPAVHNRRFFFFFSALFCFAAPTNKPIIVFCSVFCRGKLTLRERLPFFCVIDVRVVFYRVIS